MRSRSSRLALGFCVIGCLFYTAHAQSSVNVALRTSFSAPAYLIELLWAEHFPMPFLETVLTILRETAAEENETSYFPLLDRIAEGYFDSAKTDEELYVSFRGLLQQDGHLSQPEDLSSFDLALSLHSAAPRIEAHYQYYETSVKPLLEQREDDDCETWVYIPFNGDRYCSPQMSEASQQKVWKPTETVHQLPFDRILGDVDNKRPVVLYADILSASFRRFHTTISQTAKAGTTSYRLRYVPNKNRFNVPLTVNGYGVELALKRTDYIVIDDRNNKVEGEESTAPAVEATLSEEELSDLRPLSSSELLRLDQKAATFVMSSNDPFETLLRLSQDFPKHSSAIAAVNVSNDFLQEHRSNREIILPSGFNILWINGVQIMARDVDAYALLEHLRRERKMINSVRGLGLTAPLAIDLLSHEAVTAASVDQEVQRYDWRDDNEGGNIIIWLNDIEKDKRYAEWSNSIAALLQRTYPGQLPSVRRDIHNLVMMIDFADYGDVATVVDNLQNFVKRKVPIRFGLVPRIRSSAGIEQAKIIYYLLDRYGLSAAIDYLGKSIIGAGRKFAMPQEKYFVQAITDRKLRRDKAAQSFDEVLKSKEFDVQIIGAQSYVSRFSDGDTASPMLVNGVPVPHTEEWLQAMSQRVSIDFRMIQQAVFHGEVTEESWLPEIFLNNAWLRRNPLIVPEDDDDIRHINLGDLPDFATLKSVPADSDTIERELVHLTVATDLSSEQGLAQAMEAFLFKRDHDNVELALIHVPNKPDSNHICSLELARLTAEALQSLGRRYDALANEQFGDTALDYSQRRSIYQKLCEISSGAKTNYDQKSTADGATVKHIITAAGLEPGKQAFIVNGRIVGPMSTSKVLVVDDLDTLLSYERKKRLLPAALAIEDLQLQSMASTPLAFARISNLIALSQVSDVPEGIFEAAPTVRTSVFKQWNSTYTAIKVGDMENANIQIFSVIDPASELAQRWVPIIKKLSELDGVATTVFLNPRDRLEELPVKRFYRYVLDSKPTFDSEGSVRGLTAHFSGLPADALLNMGMDLPPSWLVAPEESVHDLDNIKLSALRSGTDIEAIYKLEHILIEGHSRDVTLGPPPRGAQLVLGTKHDPHFADTIIMANLGYFQFKANPGVYNLALQRGRSEEIFHIDSAGTRGYIPMPGDNSTEIVLMSFRGATLFPRLSRKPGMEEEDVLETSKTTLENLADGADKFLAKIGLHSSGASKYLSKAAKIVSAWTSGKVIPADLSAEPHADINIFSVASGHLYERMLNIMMLSVMKNTKHSVKFWFIEQFLSPSFKRFLPIFAKEYGFAYEMVTYKWPHWLRGQKEKQREIWGYKILFLDVLFPLDLDKVIFVDADQIVRTDMYELVQHDLKGAPYGFTPMCDSRIEMEGFRFWKQGYWKNFLRGLPYHISALYVVDLKKFRQIAAGDRLRQQYHQLSADPASLSNLDQDLPNHMQMVLPIHSLPQEWLWCETWCSDESLKDAKTIDLCNNPLTKEPKLDRARRQVPEWTLYDEEIASLARRHKAVEGTGMPSAGESGSVGVESANEESIQERLQREDAEKELKKQGRLRDEL